MCDGRKSGDTAERCASLWGFFSEKETPTKKTRMKIELKVNSNSIFNYNQVSPGDTADWKTELTVIVVGRVDIATSIRQGVRVST